ncbi:uncharacterized protein [Rutidosis leptorrhynchoides]|uniref:uncharacterized protein n=1 Tax=Rutidosis leptorrhynchoides TaxID=125765 RepID=UPI003A99259B
MEEMKINGQIFTKQLDVPELIYRIQSLLPVKEAARTCVLSNSWRHTWSTIPNLRFCQYKKRLNNEQMEMYISLIRLTIERYLRDSIPIKSFDLEFNVQDKKWVPPICECVQKVTSESCLKDLYLQLIFAKDLEMTLKVRNLAYLRNLKIHVVRKDTNVLEIYHLPSLQCLDYSDPSTSLCVRKPIAFNIDSLSNMKELVLNFETIDDSIVEIINSKFPFLESLTLDMQQCISGILDITSVSLKSLSLLSDMQIYIQVCAPKLQRFHYTGRDIPGLMFPSVAPDQIKLTFKLGKRIDQ